MNEFEQAKNRAHANAERFGKRYCVIKWHERFYVEPLDRQAVVLYVAGVPRVQKDEPTNGS